MLATVMVLVMPPAEAVMFEVAGTTVAGVHTMGLVRLSHLPAHNRPLLLIWIGLVASFWALELNVIVCVNTWLLEEFRASANTWTTCPGSSEMLGLGKIITWVTVTAALFDLLLPPPQPDIRATEKR